MTPILVMFSPAVFATFAILVANMLIQYFGGINFYVNEIIFLATKRSRLPKYLFSVVMLGPV